MDKATEATLGAIRAFVKTRFRESGSHGYDHTLRVARLCEILGGREGADPAVLLPAALLHDIARPAEAATGIPHEIEGARIAGDFLRELSYDDGHITAIVHAVATHRYRSDAKPATLEAMILSDADKLDAMGATGIARTFMQAGETGGDIRDARDHILDKLLNLQDRMYTESARELAERRHQVLEWFVRALDEETAAGAFRD
ncbi:MAG: HD domain-containing protein [Methanomicrobiales archaeon]|nr:HD domain-containing protein [Methanomicrobiales archaeon]